MNHPEKGSILPSSGFIYELVLRIKLVYKLMLDKRVNFLLKLLPAFSLIYLINPIDIPLPLDDAAVIGLGFTLFVSLCPDEIVSEHMATLRNSAAVNAARMEEPEVIDGSFKDS